jgi:CHAT domain-containing protein
MISTVIAISISLWMGFITATAYADQYDNILFEPPPGWEQIKKGEFLYLVPSDYSQSPFMVAIFPGENINEDYATWFESTTQANLKGSLIRHMGPTKHHSDKGSSETLTKEVMLESGDPFTRLMTFVGTYAGNRGQIMVVLYSSPESYKQHLRAFSDFRHSIQFLNPLQSPRSPRATSSGGNTVGPKGTPDPFDASQLQAQGIAQKKKGWEVFVKTGDAVTALSLTKQAMVDLRRSYDFFINEGNPGSAILSLLKLGNATVFLISLETIQDPLKFKEHTRMRSTEAKQLYQQAFQLSQQTLSAPNQVKSLIALAHVSKNLNDLDAAMTAISQAIALREGMNDADIRVEAYTTLSDIQLKRGEVAAAAVSVDQALSWTEDVVDKIWIYHANQSRAEIYAQQVLNCDRDHDVGICYQNLALAKQHYTSAEEVAKALGYTFLVRLTENASGNLERTLKQVAPIPEGSKGDKTLSPSSPNKFNDSTMKEGGQREQGASRARTPISNTAPLFPELDRLYQDAVKALERSKDEGRKYEADNEIQLKDRMLHPKSAEDVLVQQQFITSGAVWKYASDEEKARLQQIARKFMTGDEADGSFFQGQMYDAMGQSDAALEAYLTAVKHLEGDRATLENDSARGTLLENRIEIYHRAIAHLLQRRQDSKAFDLLERSRARALTDLLTSKGLELSSHTERNLFGQAQQIKASISNLQKDLFRSLSESKDSDQRTTATKQAIQREEQKYDRLLEQMRNEAPRLQRLMVSEPVSLAAAQEMSRKDHFDVLEYLVLPTSVILWHINGDGVHVRSVSLDRKDLVDKVSRLRMSLKDYRDIFDEQTSKELFLFLIQPALGWITSKRLVIIPHAQLNEVPFEAFQNPGDSTFLAERFELLYAPSFTILQSLRTESKLDNARMLVVANSELTGEAEAVARLFPDSTKVTDVTKGNLHSLVGDYSAIHFSVHGKFNGQEPLLSNLQLMPTATLDGFLTAAEMFGLPLDHARLVVLSACESGRSDVSQGNETTGMIRGLLYAGAHNLIVSRWKVDKDATALWMETFYREGRLGTISRAAQLAALKVKHDPKYQHPYYWAAFQFIGR